MPRSCIAQGDGEVFGILSSTLFLLDSILPTLSACFTGLCQALKYWAHCQLLTCVIYLYWVLFGPLHLFLSYFRHFPSLSGHHWPVLRWYDISGLLRSCSGGAWPTLFFLLDFFTEYRLPASQLQIYYIFGIFHGPRSFPLRW